jgi:hypothetical protein
MSVLLKQLASAYGVNRKTVTRWCEDGLVPGAAQRAGGKHWRVRWPRSETEFLLAVDGRLRERASGEGKRLRSQPFLAQAKRVRDFAAANREQLLGAFGAGLIQAHAVSITDLIGPERRKLTQAERRALSISSPLITADKTVRAMFRRNPLAPLVMAAALSCQLDQVMATEANIAKRLRLMGVTEDEMRKAKADIARLRQAARKALSQPVEDTTEAVLRDYARRAEIAADAMNKLEAREEIKRHREQSRTTRR